MKYASRVVFQTNGLPCCKLGNFVANSGDISTPHSDFILFFLSNNNSSLYSWVSSRTLETNVSVRYQCTKARIKLAKLAAGGFSSELHAASGCSQ